MKKKQCKHKHKLFSISTILCSCSNVYVITRSSSATVTKLSNASKDCTDAFTTSNDYNVSKVLITCNAATPTAASNASVGCQYYSCQGN